MAEDERVEPLDCWIFLSRSFLLTAGGVPVKNSACRLKNERVGVGRQIVSET